MDIKICHEKKAQYVVDKLYELFSDDKNYRFAHSDFRYLIRKGFFEKDVVEIQDLYKDEVVISIYQKIPKQLYNKLIDFFSEHYSGMKVFLNYPKELSEVIDE